MQDPHRGFAQRNQPGPLEKTQLTMVAALLTATLTMASAAAPNPTVYVNTTGLTWPVSMATSVRAPLVPSI